MTAIPEIKKEITKKIVSQANQAQPPANKLAAQLALEYGWKVTTIHTHIHNMVTAGMIHLDPQGHIRAGERVRDKIREVDTQ